MIFRRANVPATALAAFLVTCLGCGESILPHWPPAVPSQAEIEKLPTDQPDLRAIGIGDVELQRIGARFSGLRYLYLNLESRITDQGIAALENMTQLHQIVIEDGSRISDAGIDVLAKLPGLRELIIRNAALITDSSLKILGNKNRMEILYLFDSPSLTDSGKSQLIQALPDCDVRFK